jgi:hypothetical protein
MDYSLTQGQPMQPGMRAPMQPQGMQPQGMQPQGMPPPQPGAMPDPSGGSLDPALVQQILSMQQQGAKKSGIQRQLALANQLRADAGDQMQGRMVGQNYVPPNLANLGASLYSNYKAKQGMDSAGAGEQALGQETADAMRAYFQSMTGR